MSLRPLLVCRAFGDEVQLPAAVPNTLTLEEQAGLVATVELLRRHTAELEASGVLPPAPAALELSAGSLLLPLPAYLQPVQSSLRRHSEEQPTGYGEGEGEGEGEGSAAAAAVLGHSDVLMEMSFEYGDDFEEGEDAVLDCSPVALQGCSRPQLRRQQQQQQEHLAVGAAGQQRGTLSAMWQQGMGAGGNDEDSSTGQADDPWATLAEPQLAPPAWEQQQRQRPQGAPPMPQPPQHQQLQQQQLAEQVRTVPRFPPWQRQQQPLMGGGGAGGEPASELGGGGSIGAIDGDGGDGGWDWDDAALLQQV